MEKVDFQEHSNEVFCALLFNGNGRKARTSNTVSKKVHFPIRKETSNEHRDTWKTFTVPSLQF